jgi:tetratricopeptide (TPR) repeat protein
MKTMSNTGAINATTAQNHMANQHQQQRQQHQTFISGDTVMSASTSAQNSSELTCREEVPQPRRQVPPTEEEVFRKMEQIAPLRRLIDERPHEQNNYTLLFDLFAWLARFGYIDPIINQLKQEISEQPNIAKLHFLLGMSAESSHSAVEASLSSVNYCLTPLRIHSSLTAVAYRKQKRLDEAERACKSANELGECARFRTALGAIYSDAGKLTLAEEQYNRFVREGEGEGEERERERMREGERKR